MKATILVFLLSGFMWCGTVHALDEGILNVTASGATCPYGSYHLKGKCVEYDSDIAKDNCPDNYYMTMTEIASFMALFPYKPECLGTYTKYDYITETDDGIVPLYTGALLYNGAPVCPYGSYHLNGECVEYTSQTAQNYCDTDSYMTVADQGSFMALFPYTPVCLGTYTQYNYVDNTFNDIYPLYVGTLLTYGSPIGDYGVFQKMYDTKCEFNGDEYYSIELVGVPAGDQPFMHPVLGMCDTSHNYSKFIVNTDCKDITNDEQISENWFCGVLCSEKDAVYTNSGVCSANGNCKYDGKDRRLYVGLPNGTSYSYPLYASKTSWPALNFKLPNDNGGSQTCYVNLVPPEAINHFVTEKPNPLRLGYKLDYMGPDGKEHTSPTLITID
jgi:hypothetical protein